MAKRGRKSKDKIILENIENIKEWSRQGLLKKEMAEKLGIGISTFLKYENELIELKEALQVYRQEAIEKLERSAFETALGFEYTEEKIIINLDENGNPAKRVKEIHKKRALPNPAMQQYLLNNWTKGEYTKDYLSAKFKEEELKLKKEANEMLKEWE